MVNRTKNTTGVTLRLSIKMVGYEESNFAHELLLTSLVLLIFGKDSAIHIKSSKTQIPEIIKSVRPSSKLLEPFLIFFTTS